MLFLIVIPCVDILDDSSYYSYFHIFLLFRLLIFCLLLRKREGERSEYDSESETERLKD